MHRLFVALRPPPEMRRILLATMDGVPGARWQSDEQLHLTLRFIGEVDRHRLADVAAALATVRGPCGPLAVDGVGSFGREGRANAIWAAVIPTADLARLHKAIDRALGNVGLPPETRAFRPHITLARLGRGAASPAGWLEAYAGLRVGAGRFEHLYLYESALGRDGSTYTIVERYRLDFG